MTENEAIKYMMLFREDWDRNSKTKNAEALDVAIKALEKQIPKKPLNDYCWHCPNCEEEVYWDTECGQQKFRYCHNCGQKIDWN
jgi:predicted RNA-binding Zn-ribbon protein involved in translation (DUF1610 family)